MRRWRVPAAGIAAALVVVLVWFLAFRQPRSAEIADLGAEIEQLRAQQLPLQRDIAGLEEVEEREVELNAALGVLEQLVPTGLAQPALLVELQTAAEEAGVDLVSVAFGDPELPEAAPESHVMGTVLVTMPVTVIVEGPFLAITDLLRRTESGIDRAVLVETVALTEAEAGFPRLRGTWSGRAYALVPADDPLLVDPDAPPAPPAPEAAATPGAPAAAAAPGEGAS